MDGDPHLGETLLELQDAESRHSEMSLGLDLEILTQVMRTDSRTDPAGLEGTMTTTTTTMTEEDKNSSLAVAREVVYRSKDLLAVVAAEVMSPEATS